ncbi:carbohydrate ABC transporter permease [Euzebya sp.]|uniref:carbohydrate ABC transporter permease n=1 Tax=Euzebya sp. TaxID=1971409 RepID=UPI003517B016
MSQTEAPPAPERAPAPEPPDRSSGRRAVEGIVALLVIIAVLGIVAWAFVWMRDTEANRALVALVAVVTGVGGVIIAFLGADRIVDLLPVGMRESVRPWVFVGPALLLLGIFLVYPAINTVVTAFQGPTGEEFIGLENFEFVFTDPSMLRSIRNTIAWIVVVTALAVGVGLIFAVLADRLDRGEATAKSLIFLPMAISFVGASVVWGFIYDFQVFGEQRGLLNGILTGLGMDPVSWLSIEPWNNLFLMVIMVWMQTGFAMVILSAAIKSVPADLLEAGRIDGASELQIFFRIIIPSIQSSIVVVTTTMIINVLKVFDIVFVMTNGGSGTEVIAERMIRWFFRNRDYGKGAAIAAVLFVAVIPVMVWNVRRFREEEAIR